MKSIKMALVAVSIAISSLWLAPHVSAQVSPYVTVLRSSLVPIAYWIDPDVSPVVQANGDFLATLARAKDGSRAIVGRVFNRTNGFQMGAPLVIPLSGDLNPADLMISTVFAPDHLLLLDQSRRVQLFPISFRADGTPFVARGTSQIGPLGPSTAGVGTVLGEAPNAANPDDPYLGLGTKSGHVVITTPHIEPLDYPVASTPITDLGGLPQVGSFALGALSGGVLYWIDPEIAPAVSGLQPAITASFRDPRTVPWIDWADDILQRHTTPWIDPTVNPIVTANGTTEIATLLVPANLTLGGVLSVASRSFVSTAISQVTFSSLTATPADGSGIIYNRAFNFADGIVGRLWTVAGATMVLDAETLTPRGPSRWVHARIEAENQRAAEIDLGTLTLSVDGARGALPGGPRPAALLADFDGDTNVELEVWFQSAVLNRFLRQVGGETALVRASWLYTDGTEGTASAEVPVLR
jgi:hypothetical protein